MAAQVSESAAQRSAGETGGAREPSSPRFGAWEAFAAASSGQEFCSAWLALQCSMLRDVHAALFLLQDEAGKAYIPAAVWPSAQRDVTYLTDAATRVLQSSATVTLGLRPEERDRVPPGTVQLGYPVEADRKVYGAVVLDLALRPEGELQAIQRQLLWGAGWLEAFLRRRERSRDAQTVERATAALDLVQAAQEQGRLDEAAMAVVNEIATRCKADRVSLGLIRKSQSELRAISRTAWFDRKSQLSEAIECAMDETVDQECPIVYPAIAAGQGKVFAAQRDLAVHSGAASVLSVPLVAHSGPVGALTLERTHDMPFDADDAKLCEVFGELLGPVLEARLQNERWFAGRALDGMREWLSKLFGPRRPALKLAVLLIAVMAIFLAFADGQFRVAAKTVVEGAVQRAAVAPFEGYIAEAYVRAGDNVRKGQVLATFDDRDLKLERIRWESEKEQAARKYREALAKHDRAASRILAAQVNQAEAQLALAEEKLARTQLIAPFDAVVVSGDLSQLLGSPVEQGTVLFELAPLDSYRVILKVDERDIAYVAVGQRGELALTGLSYTTLPFAVKTLTSVSTAQEGRNFFRVEAQLSDASTRLRPGMEGIGKITAGERRLIWIWTRGFVDWLRISLWSWLP